MLFLLTVLMAFSCNSRECNPGKHSAGFSETNLILDKYMTDKCFNLVKCDDSACPQTVYTYGHGDKRMTNEDWIWEYSPPNLYIVEDYELDVYRSIEGDDCWELEAFTLDLKTRACPCPYHPLIDRELR